MFKFLKNIFNTIKGWFTPKPKGEKLYKFVYKKQSSYGEYTLLIVANDPIEATKKLYGVAKNDVEDIREFTEIKCKTTDSESVEVTE